MLPSVRDVLGLPVLQAAAPELLGGSAGLDLPVRWVHVSEVLDISGLLAGGELVLTTGLELEKDPGLTAPFVASLEQAGAAGLVVELTGSRERSLSALRAAAGRASLPVAVVQRRIRFVQVTEVVHRMIVAEQLERVEHARDVHEAFTLLSLENAGTQLVVEKAAEMIGAPVVLEDLSHLVLAFAARGRPTAELLDDWERRSRTTPAPPGTARAGAEGWLQTPVGVQRQLWGRLVVPSEVDDDGPAAMVLERAAQALAINRLAERDRRELSQQAQAGLLNALRQPRGLDEAEALARAGALGLKRSPFYVPVVFRKVGHPAAAMADVGPRPGGAPRDPLALQEEERILLEQLGRAVKAMSGAALTASLRPGSVGMILALPARQLEDPSLYRLVDELGRQPDSVSAEWAVGVGHARGSLLEAAAGVDEAAHVAETSATLPGVRKPFYRATDVRLRGLLALLRNDARVQQFVESELEGVLQAEAQGRGGHLELLGRYLESGGNKAALARSGYLSRPTLYARLARLEELLGVDLDDAESRTSLHVAVLLHRLQNL